MSSIIIGTAGHVDHGKTSLIKALTGTDTDRLKEEKERGITIELGFAYLTLPSGERCGIIDVPGHERFIKSMLSGAGSVDLALFIIAADEGMMAQSREHLEILSLLGVKKAVIALTKCDLVEPEWVEMVISDIKTEVEGTFLQSAPIIPVSAKTGEGIADLKDCLFSLIESFEIKPPALFSRLPIDRVFSVDGFGTVVTGSLLDGELRVGDELTIFPAKIKAKVRSLQVHSQQVSMAKSGKRVAVNLSGIKVDEVKKGCILATANCMQPSGVIDVRLTMTKDTKRSVSSGSRLHFFYHTDVVTCRVTLFGRESLSKGQSCLASLRLESEVALRAGDRFVVRFLSPMETVGGGVVIDPISKKRQKNADTEALLNSMLSDDAVVKVAAFINDRSGQFMPLSVIKATLFGAEFDSALGELVERGEVFLVKDYAVHKDYLQHLGGRVESVLSDFHAKNPLHFGMRKDELKSKLKLNELFELLPLLVNHGHIKTDGNLVASAGFSVKLSDAVKERGEKILKLIYDGGFSPLGLADIEKEFKDAKSFKQSVDWLIGCGKLVLLCQGVVIHHEFFDKALEIVKALGEQGQFTLAQFRDEANTSRKYAVAILEYLDGKGITKKTGDFRTVKAT